MNICVIPARGGSKRIPRKNIKDFFGKPIISYSIKAALESNCFDQIIVSTDDDEISAVAIKYGAQVPFKRPSELSDDFSTTSSVVKHAIEKQDINQTIINVCCLYATAPFIDAATISKSYEKFKNSDANYCLGITSFPFPIQRALKILNTSYLSMFEEENFHKRSQDLDESYHDAGQFCWGKVTAFTNELPIYSTQTIPYILPRHLAQDIDTTEDWERAEAMYKILKNN
jgi:pseudaminic acid cytidylyltransferase